MDKHDRPFEETEITNDMTVELRRLTHEHIHSVWEIAKTGDLDSLSGEDRLFAKIMLDHQDEYFNQFEMADLTYDYEYDPDCDINPFLHITLHSTVEQQLEDREPIEVYQFYNSMRKRKISHHETIHLIAAILTPLIIKVMKNSEEFDLETYSSLLKKYKTKKPDRIYESIEKDADNLFEDDPKQSA